VCSNYRVRVTLLSLPGKVYSRLLERSEQLSNLGSGGAVWFLLSGTVDEIFTLAELLRGVKGVWPSSLHVFCIYLEKAGLSLRDRMRSSAIWGELGVESLLLHIERNQLRWVGHLVSLPPGRLPLEVFWTRPTGRRPRGRPRTCWKNYISLLDWGSLGIPQEELKSVSREREVWVSLLDLLPPRPNLGKAVDNGWVDEWLTVCDVGGFQRTQCVRKQDRGITVLRPHNVLNQQLKQCNTSITHH